MVLPPASAGPQHGSSPRVQRTVSRGRSLKTPPKRGSREARTYLDASRTGCKELLETSRGWLPESNERPSGRTDRASHIQFSVLLRHFRVPRRSKPRAGQNHPQPEGRTAVRTRVWLSRRVWVEGVHLA